MRSQYVTTLSGVLPALGAANSIIRCNIDRADFGNIDSFGGVFDYQSNIVLIGYTAQFLGFQGARAAVLPITTSGALNLFNIEHPGRLSDGLNTFTELLLSEDSKYIEVNKVLKFTNLFPVPPVPYSQLNLKNGALPYFDWNFDTRNLQALYYGAAFSIRIVLDVEGVRS